MATQDYAAVTLRHYKSLGGRLVRMLGEDTPLNEVTALAVSDMLEAVIAEGKARTAQALRSFARDSFREAKVKGWFTGENPVGDTRLSVSVEVKRSRLSFEDFMRIYRAAKFEWLKNAMALALVSGQRREDIVTAQFKHFHDGAWWCVQSSEKGANPHRIRIPLELRLEVFGMSLGDVVSQCRRTGILSKYLIHQTHARGNSPLGKHIWMDTLSRVFGGAVEELV
jgi:integrase